MSEIEQIEKQQWEDRESNWTKVVTRLGSGWGFALSILAPLMRWTLPYLYMPSSMYANSTLSEKDAALNGINYSVAFLNLIGLAVCAMEYRKGNPSKMVILPVTGAIFHIIWFHVALGL